MGHQRGESVGRLNNSPGRTQTSSVTLHSWECDEPKCQFRIGPITAEKAAVLRKAHLKTHGRKP